VEEKKLVVSLVGLHHNGNTSGKAINWREISLELFRNPDAIKTFWRDVKNMNKDLIDWTSKDAILGLTYDQLKWKGKSSGRAYQPNTSVRSEKRLTKTIVYKLSKKPAFPYPGLSYGQHVEKMENSWLEMIAKA
jgi:hypothetical protein